MFVASVGGWLAVAVDWKPRFAALRSRLLGK
jgi:hypothetical protein